MDTIFKIPQKQQFLVIFSFLFLSFFFSVNRTSAQDGEKIFKAKCAVCHSMGTNKITGPGMEGVMSRVPSEDWLLKWIKNNDALIKSGDAYAVKVYEANGKAAMTVFADVPDDDIKAVIKYIKEYKAPLPPPPPDDPKGGGQVASEGLNPLGILLGVIGFLIIIILVLRGVRHSLKNLQNEKQGLPEEETVGPWKEFTRWCGNNKRIVAVAIIFILGGLTTSAWYALKDIDVKTGYKPVQPINFSHKIHAGDNAIDCQYCHSGVEKSKNAGIPPVNVCMNCHKGISKGPTTGTEEIAKIYEAAGWDPEKGEYNKPQKPIQWVKVHNLQDFVFFSHQQHVTVGKQECATCHGDLKKMAAAEQVSPLTMAWCIDCHRKTEVPGMKDNPYYESLHKKLAEKFKNLPKDQQVITVAKMGGIECSKCHY